jgi:hypothetical protein
MGDFPAIPTKDELYQKVNDWFYATNPDAPDPLDPKDPAQAEWRKTWMRHRDDLLNAEVDRVYWEAYPNAPHEIDPSKPEHQAYQKAWLDIRTWILDMSPDMAPLEGDALQDAQQTALADVRDDLQPHFENISMNSPADLQPSPLETLDAASEQVHTAYKNGLIGEDLWRGTTTELRSPSEPGRWVKVTPTAKVVNGKVVAELDQVYPD